MATIQIKITAVTALQLKSNLNIIF